MSEHIYTFETANADGVVDASNAKINGVSMITGGLTAKGHGLEVDETTLKQIHSCARKMGKVPVKTNHGTGVDAVNGYLTNFRVDADKVRGDWTMLKSYKDTAHLLEMAEKMPSCIGLSVAFRGDPETKDGRKVLFDEKTKAPYTLNQGGARVNLTAGEKIYARCDELVSTDLVASPAANPDGMFSAVDNGANGMAKNAPPSAADAASQQEPTLGDVMKLLQGINTRLDTLEAGGGDDAENENELSDEEIKAGLEDGSIIQQKDGTLVWADGGDAEGDEDGVVNVEEEEGDGTPEHHEAAAEAALARNDLVTYFAQKNAALDKRMTRFEANAAGEKAAKAKRAEATALAAIDQKIEAITKQRDTLFEQNKAMAELITEFEAGGGGKSKLATRAAEVTMFSEQEVEADPEAGVTAFAAAVNKNYRTLESDKTLTEWGRKAKATQMAIDANPAGYAAHLEAEGVRHSR